MSREPKTKERDLPIPVNHIELVQVLESQKKFSTVEPCTFFVETLFTLEVMEQFASIDETRGKESIFVIMAVKQPDSREH